MKKIRKYALLWHRRLVKICLSVRFVVLFLFIGTLQLSASVYSQESKVTVNLKNASFEDLVKVLESSTHYTFLYRDQIIDKVKDLNLNYTETDIKKVLDDCLRGTGLTYLLVDHTIIIQPSPVLGADNVSGMLVKGVVKDDKGAALPGVTIRVKKTTLGFTTNARGEFNIELPKQDSVVLVFSFLGYKRQEVMVKNDNRPLQIVLEEGELTVDEVVVTGIFNRAKESFTGAVTTVTREELQAKHSRNLLQTLANIDPSFRIVQNNEAGSNPNVLPELQLRGVSTLVDINDLQSSARASLNLPLFILDDFEVSLQRVMDLNNSDVETITILKDATATSLYGSRGANGVVVITSARPQPGKMRVSYRGTLKLELADLSTYDLLNAKEKLDLEYRMGLWDTYTEMYENYQELADKGLNYDWKEVPVRDGVGQNHALSVSGGNDTWRIGVNLGYDEIIGVMKGSERKNLNASLNISYVTNKLTLQNMMSIGTNNNSDSPYGGFSDYVQMNPYWNPYEENGSAVYNYYHPMLSNPIRNPMYNAEVGCWNKTKYTTVRNSFSARYNIMPSFYLTGSFGISRSLQNKDTFIPPSHEQFAGKPMDQKGRFDRAEKTADQWQVRFGVNYTNTFRDKHMLTLNFSGETEEKNEDDVRWAATGFINDDIDHPSMGLGYPDLAYPNGAQAKSRRVGLLFSGNYYYDMRYYLDVNYRLDGSSSFGKESRYASFYSVGLGWTASNEQFIKNLEFISYLKFRGSYGVTGNMGFTPEESMTVYKIETTTSYLNGIGAYLTSFGNPDLQWQNTYQYNVGVDLHVLNRRLQFQFDYYNKKTDNTVSQMLLPISHGFEYCAANIGTIRNEGYEGNVTVALIQNHRNNLMWNVTGRFSRNINTVVELSEGFKEAIRYDNEKMSSVEIFYRYQEGKSMDAIYGLRTIGIDPASGKRLFLTKDGEVTLQQRTQDMVYLGDRQPKINGSISTDFSYKGLMVNIGFGVRWGGKQLNSTLLAKTENVYLTYNVDRRVLNDCWQKPGDMALYKTISSDVERDYTYACDAFVQKDNVFQCTNINVSYQFPKNMVKKIGFESLMLGVNLSDIFYVSTIKRERGTSYPFSRNPNFSISCSF